MKFDKSKDPAACAAKDATRYAVHGVAIVEKGDATYLAATDGRMLSLVRAYAEDGDDMPAILDRAASTRRPRSLRPGRGRSGRPTPR